MTNWIALLVRARRGALRFPFRLKGVGLVHSPDQLAASADPASRWAMAGIEARAHTLASRLGGTASDWLDLASALDDDAWDGFDRAIDARLAEPNRLFHEGRLADMVADPKHAAAVAHAFARVGATLNDSSWAVPPDARRIHVNGTLPGAPTSLSGRWAAEPGTLANLPVFSNDEDGLLVAVVPSWNSFMACTPKRGAVVLWPDNGPWSLRRIDWLLDARVGVWVGPSRQAIEGAARLRRAFIRVSLFCTEPLEGATDGQSPPPDLGLSADESSLWKRLAPGATTGPEHPPAGFASAFLS